MGEINTSKSMRLISELMCNHTFQGSPLPENIVFIAACNPYRIREKKSSGKQEKIGLDVIQAHEQMKRLNVREKEDIDLVYSVHPLPHSLLNFVFYFGDVKPEDEQNYIYNMIRPVIEKTYYKGEIPKDKEKEDDKIKKLKKFENLSESNIKEGYIILKQLLKEKPIIDNAENNNEKNETKIMNNDDKDNNKKNDVEKNKEIKKEVISIKNIYNNNKNENDNVENKNEDVSKNKEKNDNKLNKE